MANRFRERLIAISDPKAQHRESPDTFFLLALFFCFLLASFDAESKWYEASSDHFVIYADQTPSSIKKFADRLERYHSAMNLFYGRTDTIPSPSNRVTIYVAGNDRKVRELHGSGNQYVAGFYIPRAGHPLAIVPRITNARKSTDNSGFVLYHEYAHHFQNLISSFPFPRWVSEGFAEFFAGIKFESDGGLGIGLPAYHRSYSLATGAKLPIEILLDTRAYDKYREDMPDWRYDTFYGQSWALFHMLQFSAERKGQFRVLLQGLGQGMTEIEAAKHAFGDLEVLEEDLNRYLNQSRLQFLPISAAKLTVGEIGVRRLSKGESKVMPHRMEIRRGISKERAAELVNTVKEIAEEYPSDLLVWETLAEVGVDAGYGQQALEWSERGLAINEQSVTSQIYKAMALEQIKTDSPDQVTWNEIRSEFVKANRIEPDNPIPLVKFYESYIRDNTEPTENSVNGLIKAMRIAPYDENLRWMLADQLVRENKFELAINVMGPLANHPHSAETAKAAQEFIDEIKQKASADAEAET